jgi:hypothetical protein
VPVRRIRQRPADNDIAAAPRVLGYRDHELGQLRVLIAIRKRSSCSSAAISTSTRDALNGIGQETGGQQSTELGNRHGPFRNGSRGYDSIFSGSSFFSRNGWFPASGGTTFQQSFEQACMRFMQHFSSDGTNVRRHHHVWDRCSFEGGDGVAALSDLRSPEQLRRDERQEL